MQDLELKALWQSANEKLERNLTINKTNTEEITKLKVQSLVSSMNSIKIFALVTGIFWCLPLAYILINLFLYRYKEVSHFFLYSAALQVLITLGAIVVYIYQLNLISKINFNTPIITMQEELAKLKIATLWSARILFLQLPLWTTFYLSESLFLNGNMELILLQILITLAFTFVSIWLFFNLDYKNKDKKWFQKMVGGSEWNPILKSIDLINQLEDYK